MNDTQKSVKSPQAAETRDDGILLCLQCGKAVIQRTGHKMKFCSSRCRMAYWACHPERVNRKAYYALVCQHCGNPFQSYGNAHRKYCCRSCYDQHRKRGKRHDEQS